MIERHKITQSKISNVPDCLSILKMFLNIMKTNPEANLLPIKDKMRYFTTCAVLSQDINYSFQGIKGFIQLGIAHFERILTQNIEGIYIKFATGEYKMSKLNSD